MSRALDPPREQMRADGDVINCSAFHYFSSVRKFVYDRVDLITKEMIPTRFRLFLSNEIRTAFNFCHCHFFSVKS